MENTERDLYWKLEARKTGNDEGILKKTLPKLTCNDTFDFKDGHGEHVWAKIRALESNFPWHNRYVGEWKDGLRHGKGTFYSGKGEIYSGAWENGIKHGRVSFSSCPLESGTCGLTGTRSLNHTLCFLCLRGATSTKMVLFTWASGGRVKVWTLQKKPVVTSFC